MRLKHLELQGFKTFASNSQFVFPTGITAIVGPNGSGKCVTGDTLVTLADGRDAPICDLVETALSAAGVVETLDDGLLTRENPHEIWVLSLNPETLRLEPRPVASFIKRQAPPILLRIRTRAGREVTVTPYHPLFTLKEGQLQALAAEQLEPGVRVALPRCLPVSTHRVDLLPLQVLQQFEHTDEIYIPPSEPLRAWARASRATFGTWAEWARAASVPMTQLKGMLDGQAVNVATLVRLATAADSAAPWDGCLKSHGSGHIKVPHAFTADLARFLGLLVAEGRTTDSNQVWFVNADAAINDEFERLARNLFGVRASRKHYKPRARDILIYSRTLSVVLDKLFGFAVASTSAQKQAPPQILEAEPEVQWAFLSGLFEGDACICVPPQTNGKKGTAYLEYVSASRELAQQVVALLLRLGVFALLRPRRKAATNTSPRHYRTYYSVLIYGAEQLKYVAQHLTFVGEKRARLAALQELPSVSNPNLDLIPGVTPLVKQAARLAGVKLKPNRRHHARLAAYAGNWCQASRNGLRQVIGHIEQLGTTPDRARACLDRLSVLADSDVYWDEITSIEQVAPPDAWVYDLCIAETHNFVAGNVIVHNSNIADAIRWVLGEQSFSVLRGKRTEDMIFAGSESRPRAGMAEVYLTLDNSDGWLPVEFSEVVIGRRASRDGQNEYLLNGNRVRLRDITELLSQSGLARRTYAVIGQGLIDQALSLRPEERRALFEEAAGIGLYQSKREDALRKLEETNRNLERARDILAEIGPRLRSLQRQAERSQQFERLRGELREMQRTWYGYHWARAQEALHAARAVAQTHSEQLARQQADLNALARKLAQVREQQSALRAQVMGWQRQAGALRAQLETVRREIAVLTERDRLLQAQQVEVEAAANILQLQRAERAERLTAVQAELEAKRQQAAAHAQNIVQLQQALRERQAEREQLNEQRNQAQARAAELKAQITERHTRRAQLDERRLELEHEIVVHQHEQAQLADELDRQQQIIAQVAADIAALNEQEAALRAQIAECEAHIAASRQRQAELDDQLAQARAAETELRARLQALGKVRDAYSGYSAGAQAVLGAHIPGVRGALVTLISVPEEWERAVEAALGPALQAVVADSWTTVLTARERITEGRATILALDLLEESARHRAASVPKPNFWQRLFKRLTSALRPPPSDIRHPTSDLRPPTSDLRPPTSDFPPSPIHLSSVVACDPPLRPIIEALLGQVRVAPDLDTARAIAPALQPGEKIVTREGDVLSYDGAIAFGREGESSGLLAREREWRELPAQLTAAENQCAEIQARLDREAAHQLKLVNQQTALTRAAEDVAKQSRARATERDTLARAAERLANQIEWETTRIAQLVADLEALRSKDAALQADIQVLTTQCAATEHEMAECEAHLASLPLEDLTAQLASLQTAAAVAEQAVQGQQAALAGEQQALAQLEAQLNAQAGRAAQLARERFDVGAQLESLHLKEAQLGREWSEFNARIQPAEAQLEQLESVHAAADAEESAARARIRDYEARHNAALLEVSRRQDELDALRARIDEELGLVELEMSDEVSGPMPLPLRPIVEELPLVNELPEGLEESIRRRKAALHRLGPINAEAQSEYQETLERHTFLTNQCADLEQAIASLHQVIAELDELMRKSFLETFEAIAAEFKVMFNKLFGGGSAKLVLTEPDNITMTGIDIIARPPGKRQQGLALLSGGERSLTAAALLFAILKVRPTPFCVLDEVDAALDEANVVRFRDMLKELASTTQFVLITHNRGTIEVCDTIYGITMGSDHASRVLSYRLDGTDTAAMPAYGT